MDLLLSKLGVDTSMMCLILGFFGSRAWARIPLDKRRYLEPESQGCLFVIYSEYSKGYKMIKMRTQKFFIEMSFQFEEEHMVALEIGDSSSPPPPLVVSEGTNELYDSDMSDNYDLISDTNSLVRKNLEAKTMQVAGELSWNLRDYRRTRSQFESALSVQCQGTLLC